MITLENLQQVITQRIYRSEQQRITFADFMELALYHPQYGYYSANHTRNASQSVSNAADVIGPQGDFVTSPHMGHDFGELLAEQFADMWQALGKPQPFTLMEMGAGQGLIATDVLTYLQAHYPDCLSCLRYLVVEKSPALRSQQQKRLQLWQDQGVEVTWQPLTDVPDRSIVGCAFSNELVDAFPVHWVEWHDQRLQEMWVQSASGTWKPLLAEPSTPELERYFEQAGIDLAQGYPEGYRTEINLAALDWLGELAQKIERGYVLTIDYGYPAQRYYSPARREGTLQCYTRHRHHNDPFIQVGEQDITAHVDFTALERQGAAVGLQKLGFTQQGLFLMALGLGDRLTQLSQSTSQATAQAIQTILRRREALQQLISPMGLGNFGVLIQAKGLTRAEIARPLKGLAIPPLI